MQLIPSMRDTNSGGGVTIDTMSEAKYDTASSFSDRTPTETGSPYNMSPWNQPPSPFARSPWSLHPPATTTNPFYEDFSFSFSTSTGLVGSLVREEGHIYSLAASGELLYTGSESKNIRVWKNQKEYCGFKSTSGLVKAIVVSGDRIFTGHQDGKIRIWKKVVINSNNIINQVSHKRVGSLPRLKDYLKGSFKPSNYVEVRRKRNMLWLKHYDVVSCLGMSHDGELLYSGSWDKTFKVWRIADSRCLESVFAHDDAVNSIVSGFGGVVFTGSADGTVKAWRRQPGGRKGTQHVLVETLLKQDSAVTALAVDSTSSFLYCGSSDGAVNYWEREKVSSSELALPKHGGVLRGHTSAVLCVATAGRLVLSGSADKNICVWKREVGVHTCVSVLSGHTGPVKCLAVEAEDDEGRWVVYSGSLDKSVKVWKVSELEAEQMILPYSAASSRSDSYGNRVSHSSATSSSSRK